MGQVTECNRGQATPFFMLYNKEVIKGEPIETKSY